MTKAIAVGLSLVLSMGTAFAQPAPAPKPAPAPVQEGDKVPDTKTTEKAGTDESLEKGGDTRPWAAGVSRDRQRTALQAFHDGNTQLNDGLFVKAVEKYREALKSWEHPAIYYNLALALLNLDQPIEVYDSLEKAVQYGAAPLEKDKYEHAKEYMLLVQQQLATIEVSCDKPGAKVSVDGKEVFTVKTGEVGKFTGRVRIGKHTFVAEKPGYNAQIDAPFIGPGEKFRIQLKLYTADELTRYHRKWDQTWMPYAVIGGGVLAGLIGAGLELSAHSSYSDFDTKVAACNMASMMAGCDVHMGGLADLKNSGDTKRTIGFVAYGIGGAAVATGLVLAYLNRTSSYQISADEYRREMSHSGTVSVAPMVAPGVGGAVVSGSF